MVKIKIIIFTPQEKGDIYFVKMNVETLEANLEGINIMSSEIRKELENNEKIFMLPVSQRLFWGGLHVGLDPDQESIFFDLIKTMGEDRALIKSSCSCMIPIEFREGDNLFCASLYCRNEDQKEEVLLKLNYS